ncbi:MAG: FxsA family protein, partial [Bacillota bacterium]|nr:FxsA family protein [Bacillota bacterium]
KTLRKAQEELRNGRMPGEAILDGICILIGGTLLITPGFVTDILGLLLLLPFTRRFFKYLLRNSFKKWINKRTIIIK